MGNLFDLALWISAFCFLHLLGMIEGISRVIQQNLYIGLLYYLARALYYYLDLSASHNPGSNQNHATILHLVKRGSMKKMMITRGIVNLLDVCMVCLWSQRIYQFLCKFYALREIQKSLPCRCRERVSDRRSGQWSALGMSTEMHTRGLAWMKIGGWVQGLWTTYQAS